MRRVVFGWIMSKPNLKNWTGSGKKDDVKRRQNARGMGTKTKRWPSESHKCVLLYHDEKVLPLTSLRNILKPYGTIIKTKSVALSYNMMSAFEMSTSSEAEQAWRGILENKPGGITKVIPDAEHKTIQSFLPYWSNEELEKGLQEKILLSGSIRVNPKKFQHAFISDGNNPDILIDSIVARNRALPGDIVAVKVRDPKEWISEECLESEVPESQSDAYLDSAKNNGERRIKTGDVVGILEKVHSRQFVGMLGEKRKDKVLFRPIDNCLPRLLISQNQCPEEFKTHPTHFNNKLFVISIDEWHEDSMLPDGKLQKFIGERGEIEAETSRILVENGVDHSEFPATVAESMPEASWTIPTEEYSTRRDLRSECIFSIDPSTAKDLDDALHCRRIEKNLYEVGVHIADVSFFVRPETTVDNIASKRCTSVYLVQKVIPMLPSILCERLCSLNPGQEKLTYSVIWKITGEGQIVDEWCGRTVIRSCAKLSYDHAQAVIEAPDKDIDKAEFPEVDGGHQLDTIKTVILNLHKISQSLRKSRFENGALRLDQIKLAYTLDSDTGMPNSCFTYQYRASNELVEEFMLLANISVAHRLKANLPEQAFLRCHPEPKPDMLQKVASYCARHGWQLDISSAKDLAASLRAAAASEEIPKNTLCGLQLMAIKPQELAIYFCAGRVEDEEKYRHYALNVPLYTHFTSPIRRYADIVVHRQLSIILNDKRSESETYESPDDLQKQASACNTRKSISKKVQEQSVQLFLCAMIKSVSSIEDEAVVMHVYDHSFDVLPIRYGQVYRVYVDNLPIVGSKHEKDKSLLELLWPCDGTERYKLTEAEMKLAKDGKLKMPKYSSTITQTIRVFSTVNVVFEAGEKDFKIKTYLRRKSDE